MDKFKIFIFLLNSCAGVEPTLIMIIFVKSFLGYLLLTLLGRAKLFKSQILPLQYIYALFNLQIQDKYFYIIFSTMLYRTYLKLFS